MIALIRRVRRSQFTDTEVRERMSMRNVGSLYYISILVMIFDSAMLGFSRFTGQMIPTHLLVYYQLLYALLFSLGAITFLLTFRRRKQRKLEHKEVAFFEKYVVVFSLLMLTWGCVTTILDQQSYRMVLAFIINYVLCATFILVQPTTYLMIEIPPLIVLFVFLYFSNKESFLPYFVNLTILVLCVTLNSFQTYCHVYRNERSMLQLKDVSETDELSRLNNRRKLRDYIDEHILAHIKTVRSIGVLMIDIDHFKNYNDTYGHVNGDIVITKIGHVLNVVSEKHHVFCARYGGEEFIFFVKNHTNQELTEISTEIVNGVAELAIEHDGSGIVPNISVSVGQYYNDKLAKGFVPSKAIEQADQALYRAKQSGRNRVCQIHE